MYGIPSADRLGTLLCEALGVSPDSARRVILDVNICSDKPIAVYVEMIGDERLLTIDWQAELAGLEVEAA